MINQGAMSIDISVVTIINFTSIMIKPVQLIRLAKTVHTCTGYSLSIFINIICTPTAFRTPLDGGGASWCPVHGLTTTARTFYRSPVDIKLYATADLYSTENVRSHKPRKQRCWSKPWAKLVMLETSSGCSSICTRISLRNLQRKMFSWPTKTQYELDRTKRPYVAFTRIRINWYASRTIV